jgi:opacity protein-like surface antigen
MKMFMAAACVFSVIAGMTPVNLPAGEEKGEEGVPSNYVATRLGLGWVNDSTREPRTGSGGEMKFKSESDLNLAYGYRVLPWLRLEAELGYVHMGLDEMTLKHRGETVDIHGHDRHLRGMLNVYGDWDNASSLTPFVGAGVGVIQARLDIKWELPRTSQTVEADDRDYAFAWQLLAGVSWRIASSWELELMYRYYASDERTHENHSEATSSKVDVDGTSASFLDLGVRYGF